MNRNIVTSAAPNHTLPPENKSASYTSKIINLIPVDIIGVYLAVQNMIKNGPGKNNLTLQWAVFGLILFITPFYLKRIAGLKANKQIFFCTVSFVFWSFSIGGRLGEIPIGKDLNLEFLSTILLTIYSLLIPLFFKDKKPG